MTTTNSWNSDVPITGSVVLGGDPLSDTGVLAKGVLLVGDGIGQPKLLGAGEDLQILSVDESEQAGLKWIEEGANVQLTAFGETLTANLSPQVIIHFPYNLNTDIVNTTTVGSGAVTHSNQFAVVESGAATSSSGRLQSNRLLEYHPGMGGLARFTTIFSNGVAGNTQISGIGNDVDGFFFGYNETAFGILHRSSGVDTWISQSSWNADVMDGTGPSGMTLDTSKGNVFQVRYQWLGFGAIRFYIENQYTGVLVLVHTIDYTNQNTFTSTDNPTFPFCAMSENTTNNTSVQMKIPSIGLFIEGNPGTTSHTRNAIDNEKTIAISTETNIITIRNKTTYQSIANLVQIQPDFLSVATDGNKSVHIHVYLNATLGGTPSYTDIRTNNSVVDYDIAGTTVSGGILVATIPLAKVEGRSILFNDFNFIMAPGNTMTISAESSGGSDVLVGLSWQERFS